MARQIAKTASYGAMHLTVAVAVAYALSGDWRIALGIGVIEPAIQTIAYTVHEKIWANRARKADARGDAAPAKG